MTTSPIRWRRVTTALAGGVVAGLALVGFAGCGSDSGSGSSPQDAVEGLVEAIGDKDVPAALDQLDPEETAGVEELWSAVRERGLKLGLLSGESGLEGFDVAFSGVDLGVSEETENLARVTVNAGTITAGLEPRALTSTLTRALGLSGPESITLDAFRDFAAAPTVVTIKRGDRWYVSVGLTVADALAADARFGRAPLEAIEAGGAPQDAPEETPERAVRRYVQTIAAGATPRSAADTLSDPARRAIRAYDGYGANLDQRLQDYSTVVTIESMDVAVSDAGRGRKRAVVSSLTASYTDATDNQEYSSGRVRLQGQCYEGTNGSGDTFGACLNGDSLSGERQGDGALAASALDINFWSGGVVTDVVSTEDAAVAMAKVKQPLVYIVAPEGDGWVVDPVATVSAQLKQALEASDDATVLKILGAAE